MKNAYVNVNNLWCDNGFTWSQKHKKGWTCICEICGQKLGIMSQEQFDKVQGAVWNKWVYETFIQPHLTDPRHQQSITLRRLAGE